jgi:hypothetical protein
MVMLLSSPFDSLIRRSKRLEYILTVAGSAEIDEKDDKKDTRPFLPFNAIRYLPKVVTFAYECRFALLCRAFGSVREQSAFTLRIFQSREASNCKGSTLEVLLSCFWCLTEA